MFWIKNLGWTCWKCRQKLEDYKEGKKIPNWNYLKRFFGLKNKKIGDKTK